MNILELGRYGVAIGATAAMLAGCGATQLPIGAPARAIAHRSLPTTSSYKVLYFFGGKADGAFPEAPLIDVNGTFYGTTYYGGDPSCNNGYGCGTAYSLSPSGAEKVLHVFAGRTADGSNPVARLTNVNGALYGTTSKGGPSNAGTVFSISTSGSERVLYSFKGQSDGAYPDSALINVNGTLYGTTFRGGSFNDGTVYSVTTDGAEQVLYSFAGGSDGAGPQSSLIDVRGTLYGTTYYGGDTACGRGGGCGTVYSITTAGVETVLYRFAGGSDGNHPQAGLLNVNGALYGTTARGGGGPCHATLGCGAVYRVSLAGKEKVIYAFGGSSRDDGAIPVGGLIDVRGTFYGTTYAGGRTRCGYPSGCGTLFSVTPAGSESVLHSFARVSNDGGKPVANVIDVDGTLYGTTEAGGITHSGCNHGCGTVFTSSP